MKVASSQYASSLSPYQEDKEQLLSYIDGIKKAVDKNDFESAKNILSQANNMFDKKTSKRLSDKLAPLKSELSSLSNAIANKDSLAVKDSISKVQDDIKSNKNLILKTHSFSEITSRLSLSSMSTLYA